VLAEYVRRGLAATLSEVLPSVEDRVTLADGLDADGVRMAGIAFSYGENAARERRME
jgi:hypothetical protein